MFNKVINWVFGSFFRTLGRILLYLAIGALISYFGSFIIPSYVKASVLDTSVSSLKIGTQDLTTNQDIYVGVGNTNIPFNIFLDTSFASDWAKISIIVCSNNAMSGGVIPSGYTNYIKNIKHVSSDYTCTMANGAKGNIRMLNFDVLFGESGEFGGYIVIWSPGFNLQLVDFVVDNSNYANLADYSSDTLINQNSTIINQNTQILTEQQQTNDKLDDVNNSISSDDSDTTSSKCGILCKLKGIFTGIIELPGKLVSLLIDGLKALFIPDDMDFINDFVDSIESKLGFIAEIPIQIIEFGLNLATASWENVTSISFPSISIFGYNFWNGSSIDISEGINIFKPFRYITDCLCVAICARGLIKLWERFTGGDNS